MTFIQFPYKRVEGLWQPVIPIGLKIENGWKRIDVYVDSGAVYTIIKGKIADDLGFNYRTGQRVNLEVGTGSLMAVYLHELDVQLGSERFICPVGFSEQLGVKFNVLGTRGVFNHFRICFQEFQRIISFEPNE